LDIGKDHLKSHRHSVGGEEAREVILEALSESKLTFVYEQDFKLMIENSHAFDAFVCALTGFLKFFKQTEKRPEGFPKKEKWIEFPLENINWDKL
ncbi:MAG: DUF429 domain-containing protein, partial [Bdellovibrionales bacterium]|nr:DUF429 domain-containing protein [Bdellovibrionales bacterium]